MSVNEHRDIIERITRLETAFKIRWDQHDKRSEEMWEYIKNEIKNIYNVTKNVSKENKDYTNKLITLALGLPATILLAMKLLGKI